MKITDSLLLLFFVLCYSWFHGMRRALLAAVGPTQGDSVMWKTFLMSCIMMLSVSGVALAHFGMVIPSAGTVTDKKDADVTLDLSFTHPMEMQGMPLAKPKAVQVIANGKTEDLKPSLKAKKIVDHDGWTAQYAIKRPGVYQFVMEPQPYWEPAEDCYIVHYLSLIHI